MAAILSSRRIWQQIGVEFDAGWARHGAALTRTVTNAQAEAAEGGIGYVPEVLAETGQDASGLEPIAPSAFAGVNRWGAPVDDVLHVAIIRAKQAVRDGHSPAGALIEGRRFLDIAVPSLIADADRGTVQAGLTSAGIGGYTRMLVGSSCDRCIVLAGRWYRWNQGFQRHPKCNCRHIPSAEAMAGDLTTDPYAAFHAMSEAEQDAVFGKRNAQAIREGADIYRVVNVQQRGLATAKAARKYGTPSRMTLDAIYAEAGSNRSKAVALMKREGYITGSQQLRQQRERFSAPSSRPVVPGSVRDRVLQARATRVRDPLDRATMTAQERRLFDSVYRLEYARRNGSVPRSIGPNTADELAGARGIPATADWIQRLDDDVKRQLSRIRRDSPESAELLRMVDALGLNDDTSAVVHERIWQQMRQRYTATQSGLSLQQALRYL